MISFDHVSVEYDGIRLLNDVTFSIERGEKVVLYGKSGSGKSTVLLTLIGARELSKGTIYFEGEPVNSANISRVRRSTAFVMQEPELGAPTVYESLMLPFTFDSNKKEKPSVQRIEKILMNLHLTPEILEKSTDIISGGEKQRVAIARSLLLEKEIYVLDEVTSALDPQSKKALLDLFTNSPYTIISVSHDPQWFGICTKAIKIDSGSVTDISSKPHLEF